MKMNHPKVLRCTYRSGWTHPKAVGWPPVVVRLERLDILRHPPALAHVLDYYRIHEF